jgi:hypothetical protein
VKARRQCAVSDVDQFSSEFAVQVDLGTARLPLLQKVVARYIAHHVAVCSLLLGLTALAAECKRAPRGAPRQGCAGPLCLPFAALHVSSPITQHS